MNRANTFCIFCMEFVFCSSYSKHHIVLLMWRQDDTVSAYFRVFNWASMSISKERKKKVHQEKSLIFSKRVQPKQGQDKVQSITGEKLHHIKSFSQACLMQFTLLWLLLSPNSINKETVTIALHSLRSQKNTRTAKLVLLFFFKKGRTGPHKRIWGKVFTYAK